jgi:solute carrier family 25 (mitochondrial phosphate transporter), member 23/24/25/41
MQGYCFATSFSCFVIIFVIDCYCNFAQKQVLLFSASVILIFSFSPQIPYVGLNFAVYESLKDYLIKTKPFGLAQDSELSVITRLACGAAAGTIGQTVAYPLDVIRRRMQMTGWHNAASVITGDGVGKVPLEYTGMIDAFRKTVRHEGFGALYKGLVPNSVKVSLQLTVMINSGKLVST